MRTLIGIAAIALLLMNCVESGAEVPAETGAPPHARQSMEERGKYLVAIMACSDCHTPMKMGPAGPEPDMERYMSGHPESMGPMPPFAMKEPWIWAGTPTNTAYAGPWGVSYAFNLTPDENTGIGSWSEQTFVNSIKLGKHMGVSREIQPPMPWQQYRNATDEDLKAVYAYLRSLKPIVNRVPEYQPPAGP